MSSVAGAIIGLYQRQAAAWAKDRGNRLIEQAWHAGLHPSTEQDARSEKIR